MAEYDAAEPKAATSDPSPEATLVTLVDYFEEAEDLTREARKLSERDKDYVHNDQYTSEELAILKKRKQPALTINYCKRKVETMRGLERRLRSDPIAYPRNPDDEQGAEAATDALRFVGEQNCFDETRSAVYEDMSISGFGGVDITVKQTPNDDSYVCIEAVPFERLGYDPHSVKPDFSDAKYKFIVIWQDAVDAKAKYPGREDAVESTLSVGRGDLYQDTPREGMWCDSKRSRIRVVQMHYQDGEDWWIATFTKGGFLVDPVLSPYKDKDGKTACSLIMRSMYVDRNGNRYGAVRDFISLQDEINKRRSKALHLFTVRQSYGNKKGVPDAQKARDELAKPDGHLEINADATFGQDFGILPTGDMAAGQIQLLQQATSEMQAQGANAALAGTDPRDQSGRAQQLQQQAGQVTLEPGIDGLRMFTRAVYEAAWMRVRQFWTDEKWIRVTDDERNLKWVGLNKQITLKDKLEQHFGAPIMAWTQQQVQEAGQAAGIQSPYDPKLKQVVGVENDVSGLDVDIIIEEGPEIATIQAEQFETLSSLAKAGLPIPPKAIIMASSIRNKDAILDEMESGGKPSPQIQKQMSDMQDQIKHLSGALENAAQQHEATEKQLDDKSAEQATDDYKAETDRMKALAPVIDPASVSALVQQLVMDALQTHLPGFTGNTQLPVPPPGGLSPPAMAPQQAGPAPAFLRPQGQPVAGVPGV